MVTKGRNNIKVKKKEKNEQRLILPPHKGRKRVKKITEKRFILHSDNVRILIRNWSLSL